MTSQRDLSNDPMADAIEEGTAMADRTTARSLKRCQPLARAIWAALVTVDDNRKTVPIGALVDRCEGRDEEVRAALVELHAYRLIGFDSTGDWVSYAGVWISEVSKVLGAEPGSPIYPIWQLDPRWVLVSQSEWL